MRKKVIVFCEGKILHRESNARNSVNDLLGTYEVLALVDKQSQGRFFSTREKNIVVYESVLCAVNSLQKKEDDLFLLLGFDVFSELLLLTNEVEKKFEILKIKLTEQTNDLLNPIGSHKQDIESGTAINTDDNDGHQRD